VRHVGRLPSTSPYSYLALGASGAAVTCYMIV